MWVIVSALWTLADLAWYKLCELCSMAERMLSGEIKEGDSAIIDVDSEGNVTVLNGKTGTNTSTAIESSAGIS